MIKYLGSKRTLLEHIGTVIGAFPQVESVADVFPEPLEWGTT